MTISAQCRAGVEARRSAPLTPHMARRAAKFAAYVEPDRWKARAIERYRAQGYHLVAVRKNDRYHFYDAANDWIDAVSGLALWVIGKEDQHWSDGL